MSAANDDSVDYIAPTHAESAPFAPFADTELSANEVADSIAELTAENARLKAEVARCRTQLANLRIQRNELRDKLFQRTLADSNARLHRGVR